MFSINRYTKLHQSVLISFASYANKYNLCPRHTLATSTSRDSDTVPINFSITIIDALTLKICVSVLFLVLVKNIDSKSSYNWFKFDIRRLLRPLSAMFSHVHSHLIY